MSRCWPRTSHDPIPTGHFPPNREPVTSRAPHAGVRGGGSGIGGAIPMVLAEEGVIPAILARSPLDPGFEARLRDRCPAAIVVRVEPSDDAACARAVAEVAALGRGIGGLVNNAGANDNVGLDAGTAAFMASVTANLGHYYGLAHHCLPHLRAGCSKAIGRPGWAIDVGLRGRPHGSAI